MNFVSLNINVGFNHRQSIQSLLILKYFIINTIEISDVFHVLLDVVFSYLATIFTLFVL